MGSFLQRLFGHDSVVNPIYEKLTGKEATYFTDEQKAAGVTALWRAYEPFKLIQRFLALLLGITYVVVFLVVVGLYVASAVTPTDISKQLYETAAALAALNHETLSQPVLLILGLYFSGGMVEGVVEKIRRRDT